MSFALALGMFIGIVGAQSLMLGKREQRLISADEDRNSQTGCLDIFADLQGAGELHRIIGAQGMRETEIPCASNNAARNGDFAEFRLGILPKKGNLLIALKGC